MADDPTAAVTNSTTHETAPTTSSADAAAAREQAIRELTLTEFKKVKDGFTKDQWQNMPREMRSKIMGAAHEVAKTEIAAREEAAAAAAPAAEALPQHPHTREASDDSHRSSPSPPADAKPEKRRRKPSPRPQEPPRDFGVMDTVEGNWNNQGKWYTAVVEGVFADGTINLKYVDGDKETRVPPSRVRPLPKRGSSNKGGGRRAAPKKAPPKKAARKAKPPPFACPSWEPRDHYDELDDSASDASVPRRWLRALQPTPTSPPPSDRDALFDDADSSSSSDGGPVALAASTAPCRGAYDRRRAVFGTALRPPPAGFEAGRVALTLAGRRRPALSAFFRAAAASDGDSDSDSEAAAPRRRPRPARPRAPAEVRTWVTDAGGRRHSSRLASPKVGAKKKAPSPRKAPARRRAAQVPCTHGCGRSFATPQDMRQHARNDCPARPAAALESEEDEPEEDDAALSALTESELRRVMARRGVGAAPGFVRTADGRAAKLVEQLSKNRFLVDVFDEEGNFYERIKRNRSFFEPGQDHLLVAPPLGAAEAAAPADGADEAEDAMDTDAPAWPAAGRKLLDEIRDEKDRLGVHASLETLRPKLTSYGFSNTNDSWKSGFCRLDTPASFPSNSKATPGHGYKIRSIPQLVSYLERELGEASDAGDDAEAAPAPPPPPGSRVAVRFDDGEDYEGTVGDALDERSATCQFDDGTSDVLRFPDPDVRVTRVGPGAAPARPLVMVLSAARPPRAPRSRGARKRPRPVLSVSTAPDARHPCAFGCGLTFATGHAAEAHAARYCARRPPEVIAAVTAAAPRGDDAVLAAARAARRALGEDAPDPPGAVEEPKPASPRAARWTAEEEADLRRLVAEAGADRDWAAIADRLGTGRSATAVEARFGPEKRPCPSSRPKACEVRRVGDKKWRRFASRKDASAAFPELSAADITHLINNTGNAKAKSETYEARDAVDEAEASDERGRFPCPAGCPRTFAHAPAAVMHGKSCAGAAAAAAVDRAPAEAAPAVEASDAPAWAADARRLLSEIKTEQEKAPNRRGSGVLDALRPALLTRYGFRCSSAPPWVSGAVYMSPPATFPCYYEVWGRDHCSSHSTRAITSLPRLLSYLERALALASDGVAVRLEPERDAILEEDDEADDDGDVAEDAAPAEDATPADGADEAEDAMDTGESARPAVAAEAAPAAPAPAPADGGSTTAASSLPYGGDVQAAMAARDRGAVRALLKHQEESRPKPQREEDAPAAAATDDAAPAPTAPPEADEPPAAPGRAFSADLDGPGDAPAAPDEAEAAEAAWVADARRLLGEAQDRTDRNQTGVLEAMRPALTRCGFRGDPPWVSGQAYISPPATFPDYYEVWGRDNAGQGANGQRKITSVPALVGYLERALALVDAGGASALPSRERPRTGVTESPWTADEDAALRRAVAAARVSGRVNWTSVLGQLLDSRRTEAALRARWDQLGDQPAPQPARSTSPRSRAVAWAAVHPLLGGDDGLPLPPPTRRPPPLSSALPTTALTDETGECTICYDDGVKVATLKCCGNKACASCLGRLKDHDWKCYWCRQHVPERSLRAALNGVEVWPPPRPKSAVRKTDEQRRVEPPRERDAPPRPRRAPPSIVGEGAATRGPGDVVLSRAGPDYICRLGETPGHVGNLLKIATGAILDLTKRRHGRDLQEVSGLQCGARLALPAPREPWRVPPLLPPKAATQMLAGELYHREADDDGHDGRCYYKCHDNDTPQQICRLFGVDHLAYDTLRLDNFAGNKPRHSDRMVNETMVVLPVQCLQSEAAIQAQRRAKPCAACRLEGDTGAIFCRKQDRHAAPNYDEPQPQMNTRVRVRYQVDDGRDAEDSQAFAWFFGSVVGLTEKENGELALKVNYDGEEGHIDETWPSEDLVILPTDGSLPLKSPNEVEAKEKYMNARVRPRGYRLWCRVVNVEISMVEAWDGVILTLRREDMRDESEDDQFQLSHLSDASCWARPELCPAPRGAAAAATPVAPRTRVGSPYASEPDDQAAALDALRQRLGGRGRAGRDVLAGWTGSRKHNTRVGGHGNGYSYSFTDPDGEQYHSLTEAARAAERRLPGDAAGDEEAQPRPSSPRTKKAARVPTTAPPARPPPPAQRAAAPPPAAVSAATATAMVRARAHVADAEKASVRGVAKAHNEGWMAVDTSFGYVVAIPLTRVAATTLTAAEAEACARMADGPRPAREWLQARLDEEIEVEVGEKVYRNRYRSRADGSSECQIVADAATGRVRCTLCDWELPRHHIADLERALAARSTTAWHYSSLWQTLKAHCGMGDAGLSQEARRHRVRLLASANTPTAPSAAEPAPQRRRKQQTIGPHVGETAPPPDTSQDELLARQLAEQEGAVIEEGHLEKNEFGRFMCPAGCDKTFKFAGAAIKHGTKCVQDHRKRRRRGGASAPRPAPKRPRAAPRDRAAEEAAREAKVKADLERELAAARATARPPPEDDDRAVDLAAVERPATRWHAVHPDSDGELPPPRPPPIMVPEPGRGRGKPPLGKMKRKAPSPRLEAAATYQAWAADDEGSPRGSKPPIKKLRERLASVDVLDEVQAESSWGPLEGTAAVVGTGSLDVRRVFEVVVNLLDDEKKHELRAVGQRLKAANGGRTSLPDLVRETVALVGSERWSFAVAEAARRQSRGAPPLPSQSRSAPPPLPAAVVSPPTSLPVAWQRAGLTERPRDTHSAPRPEEDASSRTLTEAADAALQTIELRSGGAPVAPPPVLPSVSSDDLGQPDERTV